MNSDIFNIGNIDESFFNLLGNILNQSSHHIVINTEQWVVSWQKISTTDQMGHWIILLSHSVNKQLDHKKKKMLKILIFLGCWHDFSSIEDHV